jgi:hypothetical protein
VPNHLRSATWREKREFGTGAGYVYPHDYEGADVAQQYLPDKLAGRRYYRPIDEGYERMIAGRMGERARERAKSAGGQRRRSDAAGKTDAMKVAGKVMPARDDARRSLAERQRREASGDQ